MDDADTQAKTAVRGKSSSHQSSEAKRQELLEPRTVTLPPDDYQPRKAAMEQEFDMPGASEETVRRAFFRPIQVNREAK